MHQATFAKPAEVERTWHVVDGTGKILSRLATEVVSVLREKHKPTHIPNADYDDFVIVINADKIKLAGNKLDTKKYHSHSGYAGGFRTRITRIMKDNYTVKWVERTIHGVLPHTRLGDKMHKHLLVYEGSEHPHIA